jgi:hypothetical protein
VSAADTPDNVGGVGNDVEATSYGTDPSTSRNTSASRAETDERGVVVVVGCGRAFLADDPHDAVSNTRSAVAPTVTPRCTQSPQSHPTSDDAQLQRYCTTRQVTAVRHSHNGPRAKLLCVVKGVVGVAGSPVMGHSGEGELL